MDYGSYKDDRRREAKKIARGDDDGMFFGASPDQKKALRKTEDKKGVDLEALRLAEVANKDRAEMGAGAKVGENLRLIDVAMGSEPGVPAKKAKKRRRPSRVNALMKSVSGLWRRKRRPAQKKPRTSRSPGAEGPSSAAAPAAEGEQVVVARPRGVALERVAWGVAVLSGGAGGAGFAGVAPVPSFEAVRATVGDLPVGLLPYLGTREALCAVAVVGVWLAVAARIQRQARGSFGRELGRTAVMGGLPATLAGGFLYWATAVSGPLAAPPGLRESLENGLAPLARVAQSAGAPAWLVGAAALALVFLLVAFVTRMRAPRLGV